MLKMDKLFSKWKKAVFIAGGAIGGIFLVMLCIVPIAISVFVSVNSSQDSCYSTQESITVYTDGTTESNKKAIWSYLKARGLSDEATAGVMGNINAESGFDPSAVEGNGVGHGLIQWSFGRWTNMQNLANSKGVEWSNLQFQLDYLWSEVFSAGTSYRTKLDNAGFFSSNDVSKTAYYFHKYVEVSADTEAQIQNNRVKVAKQIYNQFRGSDTNLDTQEGISGRIIWVGDSRTEGMMYAVNNNSSNYWICESGQGYNWFVNNAIGSVNQILNQDDTIVFNLGVNDLGNIDSYIAKLNELANGSWSVANKIIIMSVNPVDEEKATANGYSVSNDSIKDFNSKMRSGRASKIKYINTFASLKSSMGTSDGVHYDTNTYTRLYNIIRSIGYDGTLDDSGNTACTSGSDGLIGEVSNALKYDNYTSTDWSSFIVAGNPFSMPQCTYFAWSRFYQVYGYDSGARGNGKTNAQEIVNAHSDKFKLSDTPSAGAVFSATKGTPLPQYGHVGFIEAYDGTYVWISEGNATINNVSGQIWIHKQTWSSFKASYPDVVFAVPIDGEEE